jgi:CRISPR-associated endonuclease/helicase Cas3
VEFFAAANAPEHASESPRPYPWQIALMEQVAATGHWPDIAAPTGSGKSAVIDIHVFLTAEQALGRIETRPPRRLVLIAPRRVLVDDQYERALALQQRLGAALHGEDSSLLGEVAMALQGLCHAADSPASPLGVWRLRGGIRLESGWRLEPAACQIVCATPLMWGSRLLFRGYGATTHARNLETGLLAHDTVAIVDEAHLHQRLLETARGVSAREDGLAMLQVVSMTATGGTSGGPQATLSDDDLADPELARRVTADKQVRLVPVDEFERNFASGMVVAAQKAAGSGTVGVFVNDVPTALTVAGELSKSGHVELVCGRMRPADVAHLRERRPALLTSQGDPTVDFLVSTQSLEVGVDIDLPAMVTALASPTALAQRAGRLNRSGRADRSSFTVVVPAGECPERSGPYERDDLIAGMDWLRRLDGSIAPVDVMRVGVPLGERPVLPKLRPADLATLEFTSDPQAADPDPDLYLEDPAVQTPEIQLAAREHVGLEPEVVADMLLACPPRPHELVTLRFGKDLERILEHVSGSAWTIRSRGGDLTVHPLEETPEPGDVLVVPAGAPICTSGVVGIFGPRKAAGEPIRDVLQDAPDGIARDSIVALNAEMVAPIAASEPTLGTRAARADLAAVLDAEGHAELARLLRGHRRLADIEAHWSGGAEADVGLLLISDMRFRVAEVPSVISGVVVRLGDHQRAVVERLDALLDGVAPALSMRERDALLAAARHHDDGKAHPRFQRRMGATDDSDPLAKPMPGHRPDRGDGWRHEQLSAAYGAVASGDDPVTIAVIAGHHGRGRPLFDRGDVDLVDGWGACPAAVGDRVRLLFGPGGCYEAARSRARDEVGAYRLAWLEALLRCADMQISREGG